MIISTVYVFVFNMSAYYYQKPRKSWNMVPRSKKGVKNTAGIASILIGIALAFYFFFPVLSYQMFLANTFAEANIEVPVPKYMVASKTNNFGSLITEGIHALTSNFNDARTWYPQLTNQVAGEVQAKPDNQFDQYSLSIPKLGIDNAVVSTVDYDLSKHLVQYYGTPNPTEKGTAVIFGHSTIPAWFDPHNYKAIFATLHTIKIGDQVVIGIKDFQYKYKIFSITITDPTDVTMFSQNNDNSYITIVTCTPPGTTWKRLVVRASLENS